MRKGHSEGADRTGRRIRERNNGNLRRTKRLKRQRRALEKKQANEKRKFGRERNKTLTLKRAILKGNMCLCVLKIVK